MPERACEALQQELRVLREFVARVPWPGGPPLASQALGARLCDGGRAYASGRGGATIGVDAVEIKAAYGASRTHPLSICPARPSTLPQYGGLAPASPPSRFASARPPGRLSIADPPILEFSILDPPPLPSGSAALE